MAQITASDIDEVELERRRGEWLRSVVPVTIAVVALLGVVVAGSFALRTLVGFGAWFIAS